MKAQGVIHKITKRDRKNIERIAYLDPRKVDQKDKLFITGTLDGLLNDQTLFRGALSDMEDTVNYLVASCVSCCPDKIINLANLGADFNSNWGLPVVNAVMTDSRDIVAAVAAAGGNINHYAAPLLLAIESQSSEWIMQLIKYGADPFTRGPVGIRGKHVVDYAVSKPDLLRSILNLSSPDVAASISGNFKLSDCSPIMASIAENPERRRQLSVDWSRSDPVRNWALNSLVAHLEEPWALTLVSDLGADYRHWHGGH